MEFIANWKTTWTEKNLLMKNFHIWNKIKKKWIKLCTNVWSETASISDFFDPETKANLICAIFRWPFVNIRVTNQIISTTYFFYRGWSFVKKKLKRSEKYQKKGQDISLEEDNLNKYLLLSWFFASSFYSNIQYSPLPSFSYIYFIFKK